MSLGYNYNDLTTILISFLVFIITFYSVFLEEIDIINHQ